MSLITQEQHEQIEKYYAERQLKSSREYDARQAEIYEKIPEIKDIDAVLRRDSVATARAKLMGRIGMGEIDSQREKNSDLIRKKKDILVKNGFPEDYLERHYTCKDCEDTGYIKNENFETKRCHCYQKMITYFLYKRSMIEGRFDSENLANFSLDYYEKERITGDKRTDELIKKYNRTPYENMVMVYQKVLSYINNFGDNSGSLLFSGQAGLGKTFLMSCIAKEVMDQNKTVFYQSAVDLFNRMKVIQSKYNTSEDEEEYEDFIENCDLLLIDDLGTEPDTAIYTGMVYSIINKRMRTHKPTIISTNLSMNELFLRYSERISSRIIEEYYPCYFYGKNIRFKKVGIHA